MDAAGDVLGGDAGTGGKQELAEKAAESTLPRMESSRASGLSLVVNVGRLSSVRMINVAADWDVLIARLTTSASSIGRVTSGRKAWMEPRWVRN